MSLDGVSCAILFILAVICMVRGEDPALVMGCLVMFVVIARTGRETADEPGGGHDRAPDSQ